MGLSLYGTWADNRLRTAVITALSGTVHASFPLTKLIDGDPANPMQMINTSGMILFDLGSAEHLGMLGVGHHNFAANLGVELRGYAALPVNASSVANVTILPKFPCAPVENDGYRANIWFDVTSVAPTAVYRYWALVIPTNTGIIRIGELYASSQTAFPRWLSMGDIANDNIHTIEHLTYGGISLRAVLSSRVTTYEGTMLIHKSQRAEALAWFRSVQGNAQPLFLIPDTDYPDVLFGMFNSEDFHRTSMETMISIDWRFRELSRGVNWPA